MTAGFWEFLSEVAKKAGGLAAWSRGEGDDAFQPLKVACLAVCEKFEKPGGYFVWSSIFRIGQEMEAMPESGGLHFDIAGFLEISKGFDDSVSRLADGGG